LAQIIPARRYAFKHERCRSTLSNIQKQDENTAEKREKIDDVNLQHFIKYQIVIMQYEFNFIPK